MSQLVKLRIKYFFYPCYDVIHLLLGRKGYAVSGQGLQSILMELVFGLRVVG
jgi:hypothetical protein